MGLFFDLIEMLDHLDAFFFVLYVGDRDVEVLDLFLQRDVVVVHHPVMSVGGMY